MLFTKRWENLTLYNADNVQPYKLDKHNSHFYKLKQTNRTRKAKWLYQRL